MPEVQGVPCSRRLPRDAVLLPVSQGALLVSPAWATFCHVPTPALVAMQRVLEQGGALEQLPSTLVEALSIHGFFAEPRPARATGSRLKLQLTNRCNLACHYCCTNSGLARPGELDTEQWLQIVDEACSFVPDGLDVSLLGGEPLVMPGAIRVAERALDRGVKLTLFTNGVLLAEPSTAQSVAALAARGTELRISLAGATAESCDEASGATRFEPVLLGLENLARFGATARVDLMLLPEGVEALAAHLPELRRRLPTGTQLTLGLAFCGGRETGQHVFPSRRALEATLDRIAFDAGERIASPSRSPLAYRREACHCAFGHDLCVRSDGQLFGCFRMEEPETRFSPGAIASIWQHWQDQPKLASKNSYCASCALVTLCGGGCRSDNLLAVGNADLPDCGPWRIRVLCELLAEDRVGAVEWSPQHLRAEAEQRGIPTPPAPSTGRRSLHVLG